MAEIMPTDPRFVKMGWHPPQTTSSIGLVSAQELAQSFTKRQLGQLNFATTVASWSMKRV
jgi:hypothetical protein